MSANERDVESLLERVRSHIEAARPMPLSASVLVNREELLEHLEETIARLPEELRRARWLLKEREEFLAKARREADEIVDAARARAERLVQRTEIVREAEHTARRIVEEAEAQGRALRHESEDYVDRKLAQFEVILSRVMSEIGRGRERLQPMIESGEGEGDGEGEGEGDGEAGLFEEEYGDEGPVFDQDQM